MDLRKIYISTSGNMIDYMTDARIDDTLDKIWDNMSQEIISRLLKPLFRKLKHLLIKGFLGPIVDSETGKITRYKVITPLEMVIALLLLR